MHLLSAEQSGHRVIDGERVCQAIAALDDRETIQERARRFAVLGDPTRLMILTCIKAAGPISVSDLAAATGLNDTTVSQTLRFLRASLPPHGYDCVEASDAAAAIMMAA